MAATAAPTQFLSVEELRRTPGGAAIVEDFEAGKRVNAERQAAGKRLAEAIKRQAAELPQLQTKISHNESELREYVRKHNELVIAAQTKNNEHEARKRALQRAIDAEQMYLRNTADPMIKAFEIEMSKLHGQTHARANQGWDRSRDAQHSARLTAIANAMQAAAELYLLTCSREELIAEIEKLRATIPPAIV